MMALGGFAIIQNLFLSIVYKGLECLVDIDSISNCRIMCFIRVAVLFSRYAVYKVLDRYLQVFTRYSRIFTGYLQGTYKYLQGNGKDLQGNCKYGSFTKM